MKKKLTARNLQELHPAETPYEIFDTEIPGFLLRIEPTGKCTYYLAYKAREGKKKGARRRYKIGRHGALTVRQARDAAEKWHGAIASGRDPQEEKTLATLEAAQSKFQKLGTYLDNKYEPWVTTQRKTGAETLKRIRFNFTDFLDLPLSEINPWIIDKWRAKQRKAGKTVATINRDLVALKSALSNAVEWGVLDKHPLADIKPIKTDDNLKVRFLTQEEDKRLRKALEMRDFHGKEERESGNAWRRKRGYPESPDLSNSTFIDHLTPMVLLTLNTGLRRGEAFSLTWGDIDLKNNILTVQGSDAKSGSTRHIPLNEEAVSVLKSWWGNSDQGLVFPGKGGNRLVSVRKIWGRLLHDAKISDFRWHDLRHSFASNLVMRGVPLNTVRELLGHKDMATTIRYAHLAPDHKAEAVEKLVTINA